MNKTLSDLDYTNAAIDLGVESAALKAVAKVESNGDGFLPNGYPKILFEGHLFHNFTKGIYDQLEPTISYPEWTKEHYLGGEKEYTRLHLAVAFDREAALKSTSWGKFQILGSNYKDAGYERIALFVHEMHISEAHHLKAFCNVIRKWELVEAIKYHKWEDFARKYNGPGFRKNDYHTKIEEAYRGFKQ